MKCALLLACALDLSLAFTRLPPPLCVRVPLACVAGGAGEAAQPAVVSAIKTRLSADMKEAMKSKQKERLAAIRSIQAAVKQREVDERILLSDEAVVAVMSKLVKQRRESIKSYSDAGRMDLADAEELELGLISVYMPAQMSEDEVGALIDAAVARLGATTIKDMGKVMAEVRPLTAGKADAAMVGQLLKRKLSGK